MIAAPGVAVWTSLFAGKMCNLVAIDRTRFFIRDMVLVLACSPRFVILVYVYSFLCQRVSARHI